MTAASTLLLPWGRKHIALSVRREQRRTLKISVHPDGSVHVSVPERASDTEILARARRRAGWIDRQLRDFDRWRPRTPPRNYISGETHYVLGRAYRLHVRESLRNAVTMLRPRLVMELLPGHTLETRRALLDAYYAKRAHEIFPKRVDRIAPLFEPRGSRPKRLIIRTMRGRWGSFTPAGNLVLNRDLVQVSLRLIDYVIAHELAHALFPDHGVKWRALMGRVMSDWMERKEALERALL